MPKQICKQQVLELVHIFHHGGRGLVKRRKAGVRPGARL